MNEKKRSVGESAKKKTLAQTMTYFDLNTHLDDLGLGQLSEHSSDDTGYSDIEVVSTVDENDHVLLQLTTILNLDSKDGDEEEDGPESKNPFDSDSASDDDASQQDIDVAKRTSSTTYSSPVISSSITMTTMTTPSPATRLQSSSTESSKRKMRQWSMAEKLHTVAVLDKNDNSPVCPLTLPGYTFDPTTIVILNTTIDLVTADEKKIDNDAQNAKELHTQHLDKQGQNKQVTILDMWKK